MKIAVSGKGGVGKTTFVAALARVFAENGKKVIAIDADPVANLAVTLGMKNVSEIVPISQMKDLIKERTGASDEYGKFFSLNPKVTDLPEKLSLEHEGIRLLVLGAIKRGGGGCACPESAFLRALLSHLIVQRDEVVIVDMEAGVEHLGRATVRAVNALIVIVEPGSKSIQTAFQVKKLADDIGLKSIYAVGNKVASDEHKSLIKNGLNNIPVLGFISYNDKILESDIVGRAVFAENDQLLSEVRQIKENLVQSTKGT
ncbi:MAG: AAA family ATPase [Planctomycetia bacterium]|uniref:Carbon monoxide dehydrogenase n=1 Tax=Candidatus Brocadia sapporoensis TaxID=392547 RepID=A0A1V6M3A6_9BACT|nr:carbon monoxide dehydrogenase accessory protein CooC [Candidatus Brocadia sapporoensis]MCC7238238.1 AAA family ATPase [Candidatus Brocadia sp.]QOJ07495.1 MAG: AAA family ATPase [Planctomycetia bacterium]TVL97449.1 MAG: carbon monoxide dehydrogenase [Candidatus Brocadia sp. BL1]MDG6005477.1 carbon monoxide dehydrogenase [Candidatus Brocadia sp.]OQD46878.1 carbon monoxide dehydrogenase [Candidatus Brocadia sapporoensis]